MRSSSWDLAQVELVAVAVGANIVVDENTAVDETLTADTQSFSSRDRLL